MRTQHFPKEIFGEYSWTMLLVLFVGLADNEVISERMLIDRARVGVDAGRRWIRYLVQDGQIIARADGDDVLLSPGAINRLRRFLDEARSVAAIDP